MKRIEKRLSKQDANSLDALMKVDDVAEFLSLSRSKVYEMMQNGELAFIKFGRARRIQRSELLRLIEKNLVAV